MTRSVYTKRSALPAAFAQQADDIIRRKCAEIEQRYPRSAETGLARFVEHHLRQEVELAAMLHRALERLEDVHVRLCDGYEGFTPLYKPYFDEENKGKRGLPVLTTRRLTDLKPARIEEQFRLCGVSAEDQDDFLGALVGVLEVEEARVLHSQELLAEARGMLNMHCRAGGQMPRHHQPKLPPNWLTPEGVLLGSIFIRAKDTYGYTPAHLSSLICEQSGLEQGTIGLHYDLDEALCAVRTLQDMLLMR